jgi:hypothetical protein
MARNESTKKRTPIVEKYPDVTHLAGEDGGPLCRANGVNARNVLKEITDVTCRSCRKREGRKGK